MVTGVVWRLQGCLKAPSIEFYKVEGPWEALIEQEQACLGEGPQGFV